MSTETKTDNARCELTELLVTQCAHCQKRRRAPWPAQFEGICYYPGCGEPVIDVGTPITWDEAGTKVVHWKHVGH